MGVQGVEDGVKKRNEYEARKTREYGMGRQPNEARMGNGMDVRNEGMEEDEAGRDGEVGRVKGNGGEGEVQKRRGRGGRSGGRQEGTRRAGGGETEKGEAGRVQEWRGERINSDRTNLTGPGGYKRRPSPPRWVKGNTLQTDGGTATRARSPRHSLAYGKRYGTWDGD